uniref:Uncharacterized protein n=1 Tax=Meloidogyne enterolobii TaxID=390850 RepID=A0A6V7XTK0_MELEN|nr:unnamed protein product [Meloidogyne enterolobii]
MGRTAIEIAVDNENLEIVQLLLMQCSIREGVYELAEALINHPSITKEMLGEGWAKYLDPSETATSEYSSDISPVILAAHLNQFEILQMLLRKDAIIEKPHKHYCTASNDGDSKKLSLPVFNAFQKSIGRWNRTISFVAKNSHDDITKWFGGDSSHSVLIHKTGVCSFNVRYSQFRKQMDRLKSTQTKDLVFSQVPREKYVLLQQTFRQLNHHYVRRTSGASGTSSSTATPSQITNARTSSTTGPGRTLPLASHKVKVTFRDEPGEGTGVARHFYAAVAEALTTVKHLPALDNVNEDGTNKSETNTPGKSASVGPATPNMPKADDSVAASGRTLRSSTTSATSTPAAGNEAALMPAPSTPALSTSSFILPTGSDTQTPLFYKAAAKTSGGFYTPITGLNCSSQPIILKTEKFLKLTLSVSILIQLFLRWSFQHAKIEIIANDQGNCTAPSYVAFKDTERLIGDAAKNQVAMNPSNTVFDAKRLIGRKFDDPAVQSDMKHWPFKVIKEKVLVQKSKWKLKEK